MSERKIGAGLSYLATILNSAISIFLTPYILSSLGDVEYGIYRSVQALTGQLAMISIGIGTISTVIVARYNADKSIKVEKKQNFYATAIIISFLISVIVLFVSGGLFFSLDILYKKTLNNDQLVLVKKMFVMLALNVALYQFRDVFVGFINGFEKFIYSNSLKILRLILRLLFIIVLLRCGYGAISLAIVDLSLSILLIVSDIIFCFFKLKIIPRLYGIDKTLFKTIFTFSLAVFLQTIVNQINQNLDSVILGAMIPPDRVAVYSLALTIYVAYNSLSSSLANMFTPEASRLVQTRAEFGKLQNFVVRVGRYQLLVAAFVIGGFISAGMEFITLWVGSGKQDVYYICLILMIPMAFALTYSGANSVLDGFMKRMGRSIILVSTAVINLIISISLIPIIDYWGAAIGTAVSVILGQIIFMSIYYKKVFGFKHMDFIINTCKGIIPTMLIATISAFVFNIVTNNNMIGFVGKISVYTLVYLFFIIFFRSNEKEKTMILSIIYRLKKK